MNEEALVSKLTMAKLVLGDVSETVPRFVSEYKPAPVAAVMVDLDLYSATDHALRLFDCAEAYRLPRIFCYFDDITGDEAELYNDFTGERLAIREFNERHSTVKLSKAYHLTTRRRVEPWYYQIMVLHDFSHSRYNDFVSRENQQLPLKARRGE